jgi:hypothetical protein
MESRKSLAKHGLSLITFLINDKFHELSNEIQEELKIVYDEMIEYGYIPNTKFVMHSLNEKEKEHYLCSHSEKLAIGLGLISTPRISEFVLIATV